MKTNRLKEKLKKGQTVLGSWNIIPSASIVEIAGVAGLDFVVIDSEHGSIGLETAENMIRAAEAAEITPIMRVPANEPHFVLRALDIGSHGVQIPHISTAADAKLAVEYAKYHPLGKRGLSPCTRAARYGLDAATHVQSSNANSLLALNIEGIEGVSNLKEIVKVAGIDVVFLGPYDLSQSIGKPGKLEDREVVSLIKKSAGIIKDQGLVCGSFARDAAYLKMLIESGVQYITYLVDTVLILNGYQEIKKEFDKLTLSRDSK